MIRITLAAAALALSSLVVPTMADSTKAYCTLAWREETLKRLDIAVPLIESPCTTNQ
ncbi:hypothetical protein [Synechococcus sp. WH 8020]|uniref:hypothetical protein n=1 Tax=Synechococcus sp. (strain WH8020) TaxID=32052 RepID=UPI0012ED680B|nr:hypothetical protein [Synechococcus sp. WH 8020]